MTTDLIPTHFRVLNYRNIDDSGWIELARVTALVGRNESGKSSLLKALYKFNPSREDPYIPLREFPRQRYASDFPANGDVAVCSIRIDVSDELNEYIADEQSIEPLPTGIVATRYYSGSLTFSIPGSSEDTTGLNFFDLDDDEQEHIYSILEARLPTFVYFEDYGILRSTIYLPEFVASLHADANDQRTRTINALFRHANLTADEINALAPRAALQANTDGQGITEEIKTQDQETADRRAIRLRQASRDITSKFNDWYGQRRHNFRYAADGDYFRIWVSDELREHVDIELESQSKGLQWFFSFYLVFLTEADEDHKDAVLLLDEPGLHLHGTAQQDLLRFLEELSAKNLVVYTTHSPFLIDGSHLDRVRVITEDNEGRATVSNKTWPSDQDAIFPVRAAAGYAMMQDILQHRNNLLVEGITDYLYLNALDPHLRALEKHGLPDDIYVTPCGGAKMISQIAALFVGSEARAVVLLDGDEPGRGRANALSEDLYSGHAGAIVMLDDVLGISNCEIEDVIGEEVILKELNLFLTTPLEISSELGSLVERIRAGAAAAKVDLPLGWKHQVSLSLTRKWSAMESADIPRDVIERAEKLCVAIAEAFERLR